MTEQREHGNRPCAVELEHKLDHRTRFRVSKQHRSENNILRMKTAMEETPGVKDVSVNYDTGSILVHHDEETHVSEAVASALQAIFCECAELALEEVAPGAVPLWEVGKRLLPKQGIFRSEVMVPVGLVIIGFYGGWQANALVKGVTWARLKGLLFFV